jgi:ligand-binding sensor domain-containing protein
VPAALTVSGDGLEAQPGRRAKSGESGGRRLQTSTDPGGLVGEASGIVGVDLEGNSIGRITTAGAITAYTAASIDEPTGIAAGPDGALWFTNFAKDSIGRITTAGVITKFVASGLSFPQGIAAGSDGALWSTDDNSIARITTAVTPQISSFTPESGSVGATITITGQGLAAATRVTFAKTAATIVSVSATEIVVNVPAGATSGHIRVITPTGTAISADPFNRT